jgi:predicted RNA-binding Zn-ribbon protein involved in translation (DUF1610 family)
MFICGRCGVEMRCCKTGLRLHDQRYHPHSRHAADMFYCPDCKSVMINRNHNDYMDPARLPELTLSAPRQIPVWEPIFLDDMREEYGLNLE